MSFQISSLSNLQQRVLIGLPGAALIVWGLCVSEWFYFILFFIICTFSLLEFYRLIKANGFNPHTPSGVFIGILLYLLTFFIERKFLNSSFYLFIFPLIAFVFLLVLYRLKGTRPFINIALTILGLVYVALPFALINISVFINSEYRFEISLGILLLLWASDTGAYFAGKLLGKRKLFERISPKKTWEGTFGGALLSLFIAFTLAHFFPVLALWQWIVMSLIIIIAGTYGDLVESMFKRSLEIKDSGTALLGHGGFLDRFDGLLIAAPFIAAFLKIFF